MPQFGPGGGGNSGVPQSFRGLPIVRGLNDGSPYYPLADPTTFVDSVSEIAASADTAAAIADIFGAQPETLAAAENDGAVAVFVSAAPESGSATDGAAGVAVVVGALPETLSASDSQVGAFLAAGVVAEVLAAAEVGAGSASFVGAAPDSLAAADGETALADFIGTRSEALTSADVLTGELAGVPVVYDVAVTEALALSDVTDAALAVPQLDVGGYNDFVGPNRRTHAVRCAEQGRLGDEPRAITIRAAEQVDRLAVTAVLAGSVDSPARAADAFYLIERYAATSDVGGGTAEVAELSDAASSEATFSAPADGGPWENLTTADSTDGAADFATSTSDALLATERQVCELVIGPRFTPPLAWTPAQDEFTAEEEEAFLAFLMTA